MARTNFIELPGCEPIPILYEDRSVLAIDKPQGWMLAPVSWRNTGRNLQAAIESSIAARDFWARSRSLKFLRHVHRLDGDTSGILLLAKSPGALQAYSRLFEGRQMKKTYLAVVSGRAPDVEWTCQLKLAPDTRQVGRMKVDARRGKSAETFFRRLRTHGNYSLIEASPRTGRTHQIRVHLAEARLPIIGDRLYGRSESGSSLALRAVELAYLDPFTKRRVEIHAPEERFLKQFGFEKQETTSGASS